MTFKAVFYKLIEVIFVIVILDALSSILMYIFFCEMSCKAIFCKFNISYPAFVTLQIAAFALLRTTICLQHQLGYTTQLSV